jgi:hypothetical protein
VGTELARPQPELPGRDADYKGATRKTSKRFYDSSSSADTRDHPGLDAYDFTLACGQGAPSSWRAHEIAMGHTAPPRRLTRDQPGTCDKPSGPTAHCSNAAKPEGRHRLGRRRPPVRAIRQIAETIRASDCVDISTLTAACTLPPSPHRRGCQRLRIGGSRKPGWRNATTSDCSSSGLSFGSGARPVPSMELPTAGRNCARPLRATAPDVRCRSTRSAAR